MTQATDEHDAAADNAEQIVSEALAGWFPWWKKPVWSSDWDQLLDQAHRVACLTTDTHAQAKDAGMPFWFVQTTAKSKFRACRRYWRLKRRVDAMWRKLATNLLHELGLRA